LEPFARKVADKNLIEEGLAEIKEENEKEINNALNKILTLSA
jgi:hypothetical protein